MGFQGKELRAQIEGAPTEANHHATHQHEAHQQEGDGVRGLAQGLFHPLNAAMEGVQQGSQPMDRRAGGNGGTGVAHGGAQ